MLPKCPYCNKITNKTHIIDVEHRSLKNMSQKGNTKNIYLCGQCGEVFRSRQRKIDSYMAVDKFIAQDYAYYNTGQINQETMR